MLRLILTALAAAALPRRPSSHEAVKLRPANQLYTIPGYAAAAHREAVARSKHKKVSEHQKAKTLALHRALAGLKAAKERSSARQPLLDDWAQCEKDWMAATGCG